MTSTHWLGAGLALVARSPVDGTVMSVSVQSG